MAKNSGFAASRVGNFRQKNNSAEDGIDGTNGYFRRNSGCSAEHKISEFRSEPFRGRENNSEFRSVEQKQKQTPIILFRTLLRKRTQLGIPFRGTKIDANFRNSIPNHSAEESITRNSFPLNKKQKYTLGMLFRTIPQKRNQLRTKLGSPNISIMD